MTLSPRAVVVHRRTELDELLARHGTRGGAEFFLRSRGRTLAEVQTHHDAVQSALAAVSAAIPMDWRRGLVERADLDRFLFAGEDVIVAVGQDGLVANLAKYLQGQPVLGVNAEPGVHPGVLVQLPASDVAAALVRAGSGRAPVQRRTMVEAVSDDGQRLTALNSNAVLSGGFLTVGTAIVRMIFKAGGQSAMRICESSQPALSAVSTRDPGPHDGSATAGPAPPAVRGRIDEQHAPAVLVIETAGLHLGAIATVVEDLDVDLARSAAQPQSYRRQGPRTRENPSATSMCR